MEESSSWLIYGVMFKCQVQIETECPVPTVRRRHRTLCRMRMSDITPGRLWYLYLLQLVTKDPVRFMATPPRRPITFRARPLLFISIFGVVHQTIATASLPPAYYYFQTTGSSPSLLAGPYAAFVLRQRVPFSEGNVEDCIDKAARVVAGRGGRLWDKYKARRDAKNGTVESDPVEGNSRAESVPASTEKSGIFAKYKARIDARKATVAKEEVEPVQVAEEAVARLEGKKTRFRDQVLEKASGIKIKNVIDGAAAYLIVKVGPVVFEALGSKLIARCQMLFPVRLGASLYLTPKLARAFARRFL